MKFKVEYNEHNVQDSVPYILVKEFDLRPNVLKAEIGGDGSGLMVVSISGEKDVIQKGVERLTECGYEVEELISHITRDDRKCWDCGACVSICPTSSLYMDPESFEIVLNWSKCIACGSCVNACSVKALKLVL